MTQIHSALTSTRQCVGRLTNNSFTSYSVVGKESACNAGDTRDRFDPWVGKVPWRRKWQPTSVFLPGKFHGQRSLAGYSPCGHKEI